MCTFRASLLDAARAIRDKVNEPIRCHEIGRGVYYEKRGRDDRISLKDALAYCEDVRDIHERMEEWRTSHESDPYPNELFCWPRSHERRIYTRPDGRAYVRMVQVEHELALNVPAGR